MEYIYMYLCARSRDLLFNKFIASYTITNESEAAEVHVRSSEGIEETETRKDEGATLV